MTPYTLIRVYPDGLYAMPEKPVESEFLKEGRPQGYASDYDEPISGAALWDKENDAYQESLKQWEAGRVKFRPGEVYRAFPTDGNEFPVPEGYRIEVKDQCQSKEGCDCKGQSCHYKKRYATLVPYQPGEREEKTQDNEAIKFAKWIANMEPKIMLTDGE